MGHSALRASVAILLGLLTIGVVADVRASDGFPIGGIRPPDAPAANRAGPTVVAMTPRSGPTGVLVTMTGYGFADDDAIEFGDRIVARVAAKSFYAVACTTDPNCRAGVRQQFEFAVPPMKLGGYPVRVVTKDGESDAMRFVVTAR